MEKALRLVPITIGDGETKRKMLIYLGFQNKVRNFAALKRKRPND